MHAYTLTAPPSVRNNEVILHLDGSAYSLGHWSKPIALRWASALSCLAGVGERLTVQPYKIQPDRVRSVFSQSGVALYVPTGMRAFMTRAETCDVRNPLGADSKADVQTTTGLDGQTQHVRLTDAAKTVRVQGSDGRTLVIGPPREIEPGGLQTPTREQVEAALAEAFDVQSVPEQAIDAALAGLTNRHFTSVRPDGPPSQPLAASSAGIEPPYSRAELRKAAKSFNFFSQVYTQPPAGDVGAALRFINAARAARYEKALDPRAAEWTDDDVLAEARRLGWSE